MNDNRYRAGPIPDAPEDSAERRNGTLHLEGAIKQATDTCHVRMVAVAVVLSVAFALIAGRLVEVMVLQGAGDAMARAPIAAPPGRADIVDRNGVLLATDLPTASLYAEPRRVIDAPETAERLAALLPDLSPDTLERKLSGERGFVWIRRNLTPRQQAAVHAAGLPGIGFQREERRVYPAAELAAHVVGFTDIDRRGLAGIEARFDDTLRLEGGGDGDALRLSLDLRFQQIVREEVQATIDKFGALGGAGLVLDANSGEVLSMVSLPDFDANRPGQAGAERLFNRAALGVYEMGSIFKVFTAAMALDAGVVTMTSGYDASRPIRVARYTIRDYKPKNRWLSLPEILVYSSNIGAAKMAEDAGSERQQAFLRRIGLLSPSGVELPERGQPIYPSPWRDINTLTIGFGHGVAVTPLQVASAFAATVNGGVLHEPTLLRGGSADAAPEGVRVMARETSDAMRLLTHLVVLHGSGRKAQVPGYLIGGKTGTAEKLENGAYAENRLLSSFVGAFPIDDPRYVVLVMIDEPKGIEETFGYATAGWTAAPAAGRIIARLGPLAGIAPGTHSLPHLPGTENDNLEAVLAAFAAP